MDTEIDLADPDFDHWVVTTFDHPTVDTRAGEKEWCWQRGLEFFVSSPARYVTHFTRLCCEFITITKPYGLDQIDQGIWYLLGSRGEFGEQLMDRAISLADRLTCIESMLLPYAHFVAQIPADTICPNCFQMWWDLLCDNFWNSVRSRVIGPATFEDLAPMLEADADNPPFEELQRRLRAIPRREFSRVDLDSEETAIHDAMLATLRKTLATPDSRCQQFALHGLGHLRHPEGSRLVQQFIDANRADLPPEGIRWLEECRDGTVM